MKKRILVIGILLLISIFLVGCNSSGELEKINDLINELETKNQLIRELEANNVRIRDLEDKNSQIHDFELKIEKMEKDMNDLKAEKDDLINDHFEINKKNKMFEEEIISFDIQILKLNALIDIYEMVGKRSITIDKNLANFGDEIHILNKIIDKEEAKKLYFDAQEFYEDKFVYHEYQVLTPKDNYEDYYLNNSDKEGLNNWYHIDTGGTPTTRDKFMDGINIYFSGNVLNEFDKYFVDLGDGVTEVERKELQYYGVYRDNVYALLTSGKSGFDSYLYKKDTILVLDYISMDLNVVRYRLFIPVVTIDIYDIEDTEFSEIILKEELVEFLRTENGWKLNTIPTVYEP